MAETKDIMLKDKAICREELCINVSYQIFIREAFYLEGILIVINELEHFMLKPENIIC